MDKQTIFPATIYSEGSSVPSIELEGRKVLFDKKVSLLPEKIKKTPKKNGTAHTK